jgi:hypothetical protein
MERLDAPSSRRERTPSDHGAADHRSRAVTSEADGARSLLPSQPQIGAPSVGADYGLALRRGMSFDDWATVGWRLARLSTACTWALGDWLVFGAEAYGDRYKQAVDATRLEYQTLRNYAWVASRFAAHRRRGGLSFQHHAEVASLPEPQQELWLQRAETMGWSRNELRRHLALRRSISRRANGDTATLRVPVKTVRGVRWRAAAEAADRDLVDWMTDALDAAADQILRR